MDQETLNKILDGQSALTMQLVEQVRESQSNNVEILELQQQFSARNPAGRARTLRQWLETHMNDPAALDALAAATKASRSKQDRSPSPGRADVHRDNLALRKVGGNGLVVFDFDQTLTVKIVSGADCQAAVDMAFGGSLRVAMIQHMLNKCRTHGIEVAIVSNTCPKAIIQQAMGRRPGTELLPFVNLKFIFGSDELPGDTPKSAVIGHLLSILRLTPDKLMFVDDESCNIEDVKSRFAGAALIQPPQDGMGRQQCEAVCAWCTDMLGGAELPSWTKHSDAMVWAPLHSNSPSSPKGNNPHWADTLFQVRRDVVRNETEMGLRT